MRAHTCACALTAKPSVCDPEAEGRPDEEVAAEAWLGYLRRNKSIIVDLFQVAAHARARVPPSHLHCVCCLTACVEWVLSICVLCVLVLVVVVEGSFLPLFPAYLALVCLCVVTSQGQLKSTVVCAVCEYTSVKFDPFQYLSLPLVGAWVRCVGALRGRM